MHFFLWAEQALGPCLRGVQALSLISFLPWGLFAADQVQLPAPAIKQAERVIAEARRQRDEGHFIEAIALFRQAASTARNLGNFDLEANALAAAGACDIRVFRYRAALSSSETARQLALRANDNSLAGIAAINISIIYAQLGDFSQAEGEAEESVRLLRSSSRKDLLVRALLNYASIRVDRGDVNGGVESYNKAIASARETHLGGQEAIAWDDLGRSYLDLGQLSKAELALTKAYELHIAIHDLDSVAPTTANRAELEYRRKHFLPALNLIDAAFASRSSLFATSPQYEPLHLRGQILLALNRKTEALAEFRRAVDSANEWRQGALPGDATSIRTSLHLHDVYQDYVELAAQVALERHEDNLSRLAWEVLAETRATALREQMSLALQQDGRLPPEYFALLSKLQAAQGQFTLSQNSANEANVDRTRSELDELENQIGIKYNNSALKKERFFHKKSLRNIQLRLTLSEVLISFCLGKSKSFLWTVTRDRVNLYQLPAQPEIARETDAFVYALRNSQDASKAGQSLTRALFLKISPQIWHTPNWLISADGVLLAGVPFSALPEIQNNTPQQPLSTDHTLRFLPSELLLLGDEETNAAPRFLGVADPIYNLADSRRTRSVRLLESNHTESSRTLPRLVGSDGEIRTAAEQSGLPEVQLLEGTHASATAFRMALLQKPEVIHFAVHVVSPNGRPEEAALVLSLTNENLPELLTPEAVAAYRVPGSLVVLSGCSSQQGEAVPSAGLIGLSRAWLLAGAAAVVVSAWPTQDDSGRFFSSFYSHFQPGATKSASLVKRAVLALQQAQLDMQHSTGYRSSPSFWAAYSVVSKE